MLLLELAIILAFSYLGIVIHIILHESGHLFGGLISGYQFTSFRIFNIIFIKENGKLTAKKYGIAGTMGQCLMAPPKCSNFNFPYVLYNLSGGIMNLLFSGLFFALYIIFRDIFPFAGIIFIPIFAMGVLIGAMNLIPLKSSGIPNDGYNAILLKKSESARRALYIMLHANASVASGVRYKDMPAEWTTLQDDYNDPLNGTLALIRLNYLMDNHDFRAAKEFAGKVLSEANKILEIHKNELRCELLFLEIIGECQQKEIEQLYTKKLKKYIKASSSHLSKRRLMYAYSKLVTHDKTETSKSLNRLNKTFLTYPYKGNLEFERELVNIIDSI